MSGAEVHSLVDSQNPWIGLASFSESDREFFAGRKDEIEQLLRLVRRDTLTLLYGISGLGKTSLLQAGLFPALREEDFLPVALRLDFLESGAPLATQVLEAIMLAASNAGVDAPRPRAGESLWEYFHRQDNHFWSERNDLMTVFLAFDQFEEFFTLGRETTERARRGLAFIDELADLVENRPPAALRDDPTRAKEFSFKPGPVNVLLSMREDYLGDLDYIRLRFRALTQNRMRLRPMGEEQAREVIALGESLIAPGVADRIVKYVAGADANDVVDLTVAPALLSLVLRQLNEKRIARGREAKITPDLLDLEQAKILEDFYLKTLGEFPTGVRTFVEDELLTATGHRSSCALDDALTRPEVTQPILNKLVDRRLLAYEDRHRTKRVELTHDVLLPVIKASRDARLTSEARAEADRLRVVQAAQRRKQNLTTAAALALALVLIATIWGGYYAFLQEHKAYYRYFSKRHGFPVGVDRLSESEARQLPFSYLLVHKGVFRTGWSLRWKPAFRMVALNGLLEPTTRHGVVTYLWRGESESASDTDEGTRPGEKAQRLGLQTVCQWEFVATAKGEIIYERGLDRAGRMMYGLIYSPRGSGPSDVRLARFVGPDGFPQLQRQSAAEYVELHYDKEGWEDRMTYRDGKNLPAAGPDGAFGQTIGHNNHGQITLLLSIDAKRQNMIDDAGNCGMELTYDDKGWEIEQRSVGPDRKPMPVKQGWTISRTSYDEVGRVRLVTYYDGDGAPLMIKDGYHGWESFYDERGEQVATTYIGLDKKPILLADGYSGFRWVYDAHGRVIRTSHHGVGGEPVLHKEGYHAWESQLDEAGNEIALTYLGLDGSPTLLAGGYAMFKAVFDDRGKRTCLTHYGVNGEPVACKRGNHGWSAEYDERGNEVAVTYFGFDGKPIVLADGIATYRKKYDSDGHEVESSYFDAENAPTLFEDKGYHRVVSDYDARGKVTRQGFFGVKGEAVLDKDGIHLWEAEFDEQGNRIGVRYFGLHGEPVALVNGFAGFKTAYDTRGKVVSESYYGPGGEPALHKAGYHGWAVEHDERGNETETRYYDVKRHPTWRTECYSRVRLTYDSRGNISRQSYHGTDGEPVLHKDGYHGWETKYDQHGNQIEVTYFDTDGMPVLLDEGYATRRSVFDELNHPTGETYFGPNGEPVLAKAGYHGWHAQVDQFGHQIETTYFGLRRQPVLRSENFATFRAVYDTRGNQTKTSYYGVDGKPVTHKEGYHAWETQFDERGNKSATTYLDVDGKPILLRAGYATMRFLYDIRGNQTRTSYYDVEGKPAQLGDGYHAMDTRYDGHGHAVEMTYLDSEEKRVAPFQGLAILRTRYDAFGKNVAIAAHGVNGEAVNFGSGAHRLETVRDNFGHAISERWYDKDGRSCAGPAGVNEIKYTYDGLGLLLAKTRFNANSQPMVGRDGVHQDVFGYNEKGQQTKSQFFGLNLAPAENNNGDHQELHAFDERGRELKETRLRGNGAPNFDRELNVATKGRTYDAAGRSNGFYYLDAQDRLVIGPEGYAKWAAVSYGPGQVDGTYYGTHGKPVFNPMVGYATEKVDNRRIGDTVESYRDADGSLIEGPRGYAEVRRHWEGNGQVVQEAFFGAAGEPVPGPAGYHRLERKPGAAEDTGQYFDVDGRALLSLGNNELTSLLFVLSIEGLKWPAAKAGLRAGDIIWRYGEWALTDSLRQAGAHGSHPAEVASELLQTFLAERTRLSGSPVTMTIIRQNKVMLMLMPTLPEKVAGMIMQSRFVPLTWFEKIRATAELPPAPAKASPGLSPQPAGRKKAG